MDETAPFTPHAWESFYVIVGSTAGALTGLQFVVLTLITEAGMIRGTREKLKSLILVAALALFGAAPALGAKGDKWIGLEFGRSVPKQDFTRTVKSGFEGGLVLTSMESERVGVGLDLVYHAWDGSDEANAMLAALLGPGSGVKLDAIQTTLHVLYDFHPRGPSRPYAKGGMGLYSVRTKLYTPFGDSDSRDWNFTYNVGAGVNISPSRTYAIGFGATYHIIKSTGFKTSLATVGVSLLWGISIN